MERQLHIILADPQLVRGERHRQVVDADDGAVAIREQVAEDPEVTIPQRLHLCVLPETLEELPVGIGHDTTVPATNRSSVMRSCQSGHVSGRRWNEKQNFR
jgi:hypothetical protein